MCFVGMFHSDEQLFTAGCSSKNAHYLLGVGDNVWRIIQMEERGSYRNQECRKLET